MVRANPLSKIILIDFHKVCPHCSFKETPSSNLKKSENAILYEKKSILERDS